MRRSWGVIIQLMHSFEVNIRICQPKHSDVYRGCSHDDDSDDDMRCFALMHDIAVLR